MRKQLFGDDWIFKNEKGITKKVTLPHDAMQEETRNEKAPSGSGGAYFPGGCYEYSRTFMAPEEWRDRDVILEFEGIYPMAEISLNGCKVGSCSYGYSGYRFLLDNLSYGSGNILKVTVNGSQKPDSRWYSGAGMIRPVWLWTGSRSHILPDGIRVTTLKTDPAEIAVDVESSSLKETEYETVVEILRGGRAVAEGRGNHQKFVIDQAELWDAEHPDLYECRAILKEKDAILDEQSVSFGIRKLAWNKDGFFVNGKSTLLRGGCIHHDNGILGAVTCRESEYRRISRLKAIGFNAIRSSHNPISKNLLEACDTLGMYVMDEGWDMWYKSKTAYDYALRFEGHFMEDIIAMVDKDYNHPCVIMYSIGNEVTEPMEEKGLQTGKKLIEAFHGKDPTRPVTAGINLTLLYMASLGIDLTGGSGNANEKPDEKMDSTAFNKMMSEGGERMNAAAAGDGADRVSSPILDQLDIAGYNYASSRYAMEKEKHPGRIIVGTETYCHKLADNWALVEKYPYLIGDFMWTAWDYLGEAGIGAWTWEKDGASFHKGYPWLLADTGAVDILGNDNAEAGYASVIWKARKSPYIGVVPVNHPEENLTKAMWRGSNALPYWSYKNCEGNPAQIEVYGDGAEAELFINGISAGKLKLEKKKAVFNANYASGNLKAVLYDTEGRYLTENVLHSADPETKIAIRREKQFVPQEGILYLDIDLTGQNGEIECNSDTRLTVRVEGGKLLGFGSANPRTEETFNAGRYTTWYGRSLAVIKKDETSVTVTVQGEGLKDARIIL
ncbi:MAG TPA: glycoside hydrolase family 2 TIM barrel-domain containing protein [Lachnospiraceae bacterium]|nr:glycoside hydrolase family 2 TIM barrel-domain containing protein [Lachnospiraceae bacterium]